MDDGYQTDSPPTLKALPELCSGELINEMPVLTRALQFWVNIRPKIIAIFQDQVIEKICGP